jgi:hypothetical protein
MLKKLKPIGYGLAIVLVTLLANNAASALGLNSLLAAGTTRYAVKTSNAGVSINSQDFVDLSGMSTSINIPTGKHGDVMVFFCGEVVSDSYTIVLASMNGATIPPGDVQLRTPATGSESQCVNFAKTGVGAGTKNIKIRWRGSDTQQQQMFDRSMIVVVNIH